MSEQIKSTKSASREQRPLTLEFVLTEVKRILDEERAGTNSVQADRKLAA